MRSSSMVWRIKRPMVMNGLVMVSIPGAMRRAGMESPSPAGERQSRGYEKSPPHARGRGFCLGELLGLRGITPACAGKSEADPVGHATFRNHPRMRGEECTAASIHTSSMESPPHARGRDPDAIAAAREMGITPACAGKSRLAPGRTTAGWNHPRMRGEEPHRRHTRTRPLESPPHARGRACARANDCGAQRNHPRVRGEEKVHTTTRVTDEESPPHARGRAA